MGFLIIETSRKEAFLSNGEKILFLDGGRDLSKNLFPLIASLVPDLKQLKGIAVGIGPGSYTGTRVGATVAQTLSFALNIPLYGFPSSLPFREGKMDLKSLLLFLSKQKPTEQLELLYV